MRKGALLVFLVVFGVHLAIDLAVGWEAWDDAYITMACARTFAEAGHIALTPLSETVEASTSPAWFLLLTAAYKLGAHDVFWFHLVAQVLASLCAGVAAVLLYRLIRPAVPGLAGPISVIALLLAPFRTESANGMEMNLLCVLVLVIMLQLRRTAPSPGVLIFAAALVPWVRLEAMGYVCVAACAIWLFSRRKHAAVTLIVASIGSFAALSVIRYFVFGTVVLTNTMLAKTMAPYSVPGEIPLLSSKAALTILEPVFTALPALLLMFALSRRTGTSERRLVGQMAGLARSRRLPASIAFGVAYFVAYVGVDLVAGNNSYNWPGRMGSSALLSLVAAVAMSYRRPVSCRRTGGAPLARTGRLRDIGRRYATSAAVVVLMIIPILGVVGEDTILIWLNRFPHHDRSWQLTRARNVYDTGLAADHVRQLLGQPELTFMLADVGLASFCCERLVILDLGLLANKELTSMGWRKFPEYFAEKRPDLIHIHREWSALSRIYENPDFTEHYTPIVVYDSLLYLRNDLFEKLKGRCAEADVHEEYFFPFSALDTSREPGDGKHPVFLNEGVLYVDDQDYADVKYQDSLHLKAFCRLG